MRLFLRVLKKALYVLLSVAFLVLLSNLWVVESTSDRVYFDDNDLPSRKVALVLGTSHLLTNGEPNPFFESRMETAAMLFKVGKITHFIVSGDNRTRYYNEPQEMRKALLKLGVPSASITLDYAGLRTLDSVVRSKEIFGQDKILIITQAFHSYRALFISQYYDIDAVAYVAQEPEEEDGLPVYLREYLARTKAVLDLYVLKTAPRHLGDKEPIKL